MTTNAETPRVVYAGSGSTGPFSLSVSGTPFTYTAASQIVVKHYDEDGVETDYINSTHYTLSAASVATGDSAATLTLTTALATGETLIIERVTTIDSGFSLASTGGVFEATVDKVTRILQEFDARLDRTLLAHPLDTVDFTLPSMDGSAGDVLLVNADEDALIFGSPTDGAIAVSAEMVPVVTAATLIDAKDILGIEYWIEDFYQSADGDDWGLTIARAIAAVVTEMATSTSYSGRIRFRARNYNMATAVTIGNGSASAYSTVNGVVLVGSGAAYMRPDSPSGPLEDNGTRFTWTGAAGATMVTIAGPCYGNAVQNITLNCDDLAAKGLELSSANRGLFPQVTISDFTSTGLRLTCVAAETIGGQTEAMSTEGNEFFNLRVNGNDSSDGTTCIDLDGYTGSASNGKDSTRNYFYDTYLIVNRVGGTGVRLAFCDQNAFHNIVMTGADTADGNQASIRFVGTQTVPGGFNFPQNNVFSGVVDTGQQLPVVQSGTIGGGNVIDNMTSFDQQVVPVWPHNQTLRFRMLDRTTAWPNGNFWSDGGLSVLERAWRNRLLNSKFERATLGTTIVNPGAAQELLDGWYLTYDGSVTCTVTRERFTTGQGDVPFEPRYFMRIAVSAASGNSFFFLGQNVPSVETLEGRQTVISAWLKADATRAVSARLHQDFGTGGAPSAAAATIISSQDVTTSWARFAYEGAMISTSGKTLGTNGDDHVRVLLGLPLDTALTIDIALPQWEAGKVDTAPDLRPHWSEEPSYWTNPINIEAEAALTGAADRLSYYTSASAKALATFTSFARTLLDDADATAARSTLGLVVGTDVQAFDAELAAIAGLTSAADKLPYFTGSGTAALANFTSFGRSLAAAADGQIPFPATQNPSSDANTLDDYEEGSWTPAASFATPGDSSIVLSQAVGSYIKIGRMVTLWAQVTTSTFTHTTASGSFQITGLPFAAENVTNLTWRGLVRWQGITKANYTQVNASIAGGGSTMTFAASGSGQAAAGITAADMPTGGTVNLSIEISYLAAA